MNLTMIFETHHYGTFAELYEKFSKEKVKSDLENKRKEFMAKQKRFSDSLSRAQKLDSIKNASKKK